MGGTLPVLGKFMIRSLAVRGKTVARLYYVNSFGAVLGTFLAGFYLVYHFGLELSLTIAALINLAVGVGIIIFKNAIENSRDRAKPRTAPSRPDNPETPTEESFSNTVVTISLVSIFLSGFVAMLYEVVWIRLLSLVLGSSTYSFSLMLAAFISGISIGSFIISRYMPRFKHTFLAFGICELLIGLFLILSLPFYEKLPALFMRLSVIFARTPETFSFYSTLKFLLAFLVMLPPTLFLGMTLPLVSRIASRRLESLGRKIGGVFAINTTGNILGALITGLAILPALGLKHSLELGIVINIILGSVIILKDKTLPLKRSIVFVSIPCLIFMGYKIGIPDWNKANFMAEVFRSGGKHMSSRELSIKAGERKILYYKDGLDTTVSIVKTPGALSLFVNGKTDASTGGDMNTQVLCAQFPLVLKPGAKDVLVVGFGSGITCGSALLHPIDKLDVVEISQSVVEASPYFAEYNYDPLRDERLNLYVEDAKTFLQRSGTKYDLIINEPSNPWMSGIGSLFTIEYFTDCLRRLKKGGLMVQWVQTYETNDEIFETVLRTFSTVFPDVTVWTTGKNDVLLLGSNEPLKPDLRESKSRMELKAVKSDLSRIKIRDLFTLLALQLASGQNARQYAFLGSGVNSDYFPKLGYKAPLALYLKSSAKNSIEDLDERRLIPEKNSLFIKDYVKNYGIDDVNMKNLFLYIGDAGIHNRNLLFSLVRKWRAEYPDDRDALSAYALYNNDSLENGVTTLENLIFKERVTWATDQYAHLLLERHKALKSFMLPEIFTETVKGLESCIRISPEDKKAKLYIELGEVYEEERYYEKAIGYYLKAGKLMANSAQPVIADIIDLTNTISFAFLKGGRSEEALQYAQKALSLDSGNLRSLLLIKLALNQLR